jgi:nucleoside phosphorylase
MDSPQFNLVVALPAEAKPLISHFRLKRQQPDGEFPIYSAGDMALVLSGVGKHAAAMATEYLFQHRKGSAQTLWLNIGIAGHASRPIGEAIMVKRVVDGETNKEWVLSFGFAPACEIEDLVTLEQPKFDYQHPEAVDMEAAGMIGALAHLAPEAKAYCLKIISDNQDNPAHGISGPMVTRLINDQISTISELVNRLQTGTPSFTITQSHEAL